VVVPFLKSDETHYRQSGYPSPKNIVAKSFRTTLLPRSGDETD